LVALLQNTQRRGEQAIHIKLDAIADGMADLMSHFADEDDGLRAEIEDLKAAVGLEEEV
jgi:low affinity Fe/Cu permease